MSDNMTFGDDPRKEDRLSKAQQEYERLRERRKEKELERMKIPFLDEEVMNPLKPLDCSMGAFRRPQLRKCPFGLADISEFRRVQPGQDHDGGLDGINWKIRVGSNDVFYVMKVFWDPAPPWPHYFAAQRECQNVALLQMMEAAVSDDVQRGDQNGPVLLHPEPRSLQEAKTNLRAFSNEGRQHCKGMDQDGLRLMDKIPRMRKCYGWLRFTGRELRHYLPRRLEPPPIRVEKIVRRLDDDASYVAVVYEFVDEGDNDYSTVKSVLEFLWHAGFSHADVTLPANWKNGVLIDLSDIVMPGAIGWSKRRYGIIDPNIIFQN
ncbi:hypothetical protein UVI_02064500 [Ustilaginoidea virens]|uniref:Uncharacterized protein n=1 Tax=Ustilaginoidea virens TaxID=1159556 RepID=A0A1B5LAI6_USTVR|nr:hypothetical protein UVI_02064500 [Ustilaginoidea virens]